MKKVLALAFLAGLVAAPQAMAELKVGDDAPKLSIKEWVKGKPFDLTKAKDKDVVVVEFWATWCGPCRMSIPHMSEMQDHFKDKGVTFIGVSDEDAKVVEKFLKGGFDEKMRYRVAIDDEELTDFFTHLNYTSEMGALYRQLLDGWKGLDAGVFVAYLDIASPSQWGSWGNLRHLGDRTARWDALVAARDAAGQ